MNHRTHRWTALDATRVALLGVVAASLASSCDETRGADVELREVAERIPAIAGMLEVARSSPPRPTDDGFVVEAIARPATAGPGWQSASKKVSVEVDAETARMVVRTARGVEIAATRLGGPLRAELEGASVLLRGPGGAASAALLARPTGVEDLLLPTDDEAPAGYELELPVGWSLRQPGGFPGLVEIRDPRGRPRLRVVADVAWDAAGRRFPVTARLDGRRVIFSVPGAEGRAVTIDPEWQDTGSPARVRARSTATLTQDGKVLVVGGIAGTDEVLADTYEVLCTSEIYDPLDQTWEAGPPLQEAGDEACTPIMEQAAVPMPDGSVLLVGGANHDAFLGANQPAALRTAWIYDLGSRSFRRTGPMGEARVHHTATLLQSGKVLITGGMDRLTPLQEEQRLCPKVGDELCLRCVGTTSAEIYDPATGTFERLEMPEPRACHTATLLGDDSVLLVGGGGLPEPYGVSGLTGAASSSLTLYRDGAFVQLPTQLHQGRFGHVAVHRPDRDEVVVAFGRDRVGLVGPRTGDVHAEVLDLGAILSDDPPATTRAVVCGEAPEGEGGGASGSGGAGGSGEGGAGDGEGGAGGEPGAADGCPPARSYATAVLDRSGRALVVGGQDGARPLRHVDLFDFDAGRFVAPRPPQLLSPVIRPVLAALPTGKLLLVGLTAPAELLDDTAWSFDPTSPAPMVEPRAFQTVTPLPDGTVLVAGGFSGDHEETGGVVDTAEVFDPGAWASTEVGSRMSSTRVYHTATLLPATANRGPRVLLAGGLRALLQDEATVVATASVDLYDPETRTFSPTGSMNTARALHAAVRLATGEVLVVGGQGDRFEALPPSAEIYDPASGTWTELPSPSTTRIAPTASLLPSGDVLVAGGFVEQRFEQTAPVGEIASAELFDRTTGTFRDLKGMIAPRGFHRATTLPDGSVLVTGGSAVARVAEIFDPETEAFRPTDGLMEVPRYGHSAVALPSGKVLLAGGGTGILDAPRDDAELYDPVSEHFTHVAPVPGAGQVRWHGGASLLPDGSVVLFGGHTDVSYVEATASISRLLPIGSLVSDGADLISAPPYVLPGTPYPITGLSLASYWETSSGPYASATGAPIAIWMPLVGAPVLGTFAPWSSETSTWVPSATSFSGDGFLFAARHGQTSAGLPVGVGLAPNGVPCAADAACASGFCSDGVCCNERCHVAGDPDAVCRACSSEAIGFPIEDGVCTSAAEDTDPQEDCTQAAQCSEKFAVCGGGGTCKACLCASSLDCAPGYVCSATGACEPEPDGGPPPEPGCRAAPGSASNDVGAAALLAAGLGIAAARRRSRSRAVAGAR